MPDFLIKNKIKNPRFEFICHSDIEPIVRWMKLLLSHIRTRLCSVQENIAAGIYAYWGQLYNDMHVRVYIGCIKFIVQVF